MKLAYLIFLFIFSCESNKRNELEIQIIRDTLIHLIQPIPPNLPPAPKENESEEELMTRLQKLLEIHELQKLDKEYTIYIKDSLVKPNQNWNYHYKKNDYNKLLEKLNSNKLNIKNCNLNEIKQIKNYTIINHIPKKKHLFKENSIGVVRYSRIVFNEKLNKAAFYLDYSCGNLCGGTHFVIVEKNKDKWIITLNENIGVS